MSVSVRLARGQFEVVCYPVYCMDKYIVTDIRNAGEWDVGGFGSGRLIADRYLVQDIDSLKCLSLWNWRAWSGVSCLGRWSVRLAEALHH